MTSRREEHLHEAFAKEYGTVGTHMARTPGRVNLIGDHTDYNGLPVMPMAIQRDLMLLCRARTDSTVRAANVDRQFAPRSFEIQQEIAPYDPGDWGNYLKAGGQALAQQYASLCGFDAMVSSDIPIASGLSSSTALMMASALMILDLNDVAISGPQLMEMMARAEHYVGTRGGGMDQAICLGAQPQSASRIDFNPMQLTPIPVPSSWRFVIASSLVQAEKSGAAREVYNSRTRECREALGLVTAACRVPDGTSYKDLMSNASACELLGVAERTLEATLVRRFRHVVTEASRVDDAEQAMRADDVNAFGRLMSESHASLRDDFEVSCEELDNLTEIATGSGASGARLSGAGFGGCMVALCTADDVDGVVDALTAEFYSGREFGEQLEDVLFIAEPSKGACVMEV
ncbi:MAG: galactokinase [Gemmatimonadota bacterium]|nr:MAG: galactokinase [Gemmatimonadota bacterium]